LIDAEGVVAAVVGAVVQEPDTVCITKKTNSVSKYGTGETKEC
jgi:hypothetical protein